MLVRIGIAANVLGVTTKTLRRWEEKGRLSPTLRTLGGHRRYETADLHKWNGKNTGTEGKKEKGRGLSDPVPERAVGYVRVSSGKQKDDLVRQREHVRAFIESHGWELDGVYQDIASGLNDTRAGLKRMLQRCYAGDIDRVVVTYSDRLARFGTNILEWSLKLWGVQIVRISPVRLTNGAEQRLLEDFIALMTSFMGKFYRMRRNTKKKVIRGVKEQIQDEE